MTHQSRTDTSTSQRSLLSRARSGSLRSRFVTVGSPDQRPQGRINRSIDVISLPFGKPLSWLWKRGFRFLFLLDAAVLFSAMVVINFVRFGTDWPTYPLSHYWIGFSIATAIHLLINYFSGLYEREADVGSRPWLPRVSLAMAIGIGMDGLAALVADRYLMPRLNLALLLVIGSATLTLTRNLSRIMARQRRGPARLALIGSLHECARIRTIINAEESSLIVVAESETTSGLHDARSSSNVTDILILDLDTMSETPFEHLTDFSQSGISVHQRISSTETLLGLRAVREISGIPFTRLHTRALSSHQERLKRILELLIIASTSPLWLTLLGATGLYVRIFAGPGVIYRQARVGYLERQFRILKFRTMVKDAESQSGPQLSLGNDPRVIPALRWLRASRFDELPQIWNVIRGDMSMIGPRPERPELVAEIEKQVPGYQRRHDLKPGMTGLAQVQGRYNSDAEHKLGYDLQYLANWSLVLDIQILLRTIWVVLTRRV